MEKTPTTDWNRIRSIFEDAVVRPVEERRRYAEEVCGADQLLLNEVLSLLESHESSHSFLERPAVLQVYEIEQQSNQLSPGQRLLHYEIRELIGKGGMGEVYLARDTKLDRNVAIKLLRKDLLPQARASERLLREARAAALLEHPNICHIHEISEADGFSFIVMQYIVGTTLDEILSAGGIDVATSLDLGAQIAEGLAEAHSQGIVHRDIKPANVIISEKRQAKILDFGLAKFVEAGSGTEAVSRIESTGGIMGTIPYMSPEQLSGRAVDARTDVFSFGSLLFEMISGTPAFRRERNEDTISAILTEEPDWSLVSPVLRPLLERCLAKDPARRYPSAGEVAEALVAAGKLEQTQRSIGSRAPNAKRKAAATDQSEVETASYSMAVTQALGAREATREPESGIRRSNITGEGVRNHWQEASKARSRSRAWYPFPEFRKAMIAAIAAVAFVAAGAVGYYLFSTPEPAGNKSPSTLSASKRLYWELSSKEKLRFISNRVLQIQTLVGDDQRGISQESLDGIAREIAWYVNRRDSLSQEPFNDGLRAVYGRASQYVPLVSEEFDKQKVPNAIGIYQAMVESEFRDCLMNDAGPTGVFQFTKATAEQNGLGAKDRCRVDMSSKAAAAYNSKLLRSLGGERTSWTLAILSFNQGEEMTRSQIGELVAKGVNERNYWAISENRQQLSSYDPESGKYVHRFFAAAIIGENPEMFGLVTPPLSTIRVRTALGPPTQVHMVSIPGGTFLMGRDDSPNDVENPEHTVKVEGFSINKTEVTNIEFYEFVFSTGYEPDRTRGNFLAHWVNGRPLDSDENAPVRFVNVDDINAYIQWRSQKDGVQYRLPTEEEWEYVARNGSKNDLYPWGDEFDQRCAHINQGTNDPVPVGTKTCPNQWGVQDLIGNVFEWTGSEPWVYPGSPLEPVAAKGQYMIRGGGAFDKTTGRNAITSTFRHPIPANRRSPGLGFRLVTSP